MRRRSFWVDQVYASEPDAVPSGTSPLTLEVASYCAMIEVPKEDLVVLHSHAAFLANAVARRNEILKAECAR